MAAQIAIYDENGNLDTTLDTSYMRILGYFDMSSANGEFYDERMIGQDIWYTVINASSTHINALGEDFMPSFYTVPKEGKIKWVYTRNDGSADFCLYCRILYGI